MTSPIPVPESIAAAACVSCGGGVAWNAARQQVGRVCDACGTPALVPSDSIGAPVFPSGVLPFRVSEADARARLTKWLKSKFVRRIAIDTVRGVYLPCWVFNARVSCRWRGETYRTRDGESERVGIDGIVERIIVLGILLAIVAAVIYGIVWLLS